MPIPTAPALFIGLGARVLLNTINTPGAERSVGDSILLGVWQGVGVQCVGGYIDVNAAIFLGFAIAAKLLYDYSVTPTDLYKCLMTVVGVLGGVVGTELLSYCIDQYFAPETTEPRKRARTTSIPPRFPSVRGYHQPKPSHARIVQFRPSVEGGSVESEVAPRSQVPSDITSIGSSFELIGHKPTSTPIEREIAALRARASLADSERRRYREEREWALEQGNVARAEQMKSEYKRYKALMESCHREADLKLLALEASKNRGSRRQDPFDFPRDSPPPDRDPVPVSRGPVKGTSHQDRKVSQQSGTRPSTRDTYR